MTERELSYKTNKELAGMVKEMADMAELNIQNFCTNLPEEIMDQVRQECMLLNEVSRRLRTEPHITFEDAQFDM
jgi:hypothetical protein